MKIRMLVGACGLALAGTSMAATPMVSKFDKSKAIPAEEMAAYRLAKTEAGNVNAPKRSLITGASRGSALVYEDDLDTQDADNMLPQDGPGIYIRAVDLTEPAGYEGPLSLNGQLNADNSGWTGSAFISVVDNAVAQSDNDGNPANGEYNGPVGGPDPGLTRGGMLNIQRASVNDALVDEGFGINTARTLTNLYTGLPDEPLFMQVDIYKPNHETFQWVRPVSFTEGFIVTQILMGGFNSGGLFLPLSQKFGDPNLIEGAVLLANVPGDPDSGEFVINPKFIAEGDWFTLGVLLDPSVNGKQILIRDSETLEDNDMDGNPDWQMPVKVGEDPMDPMAPRMFSEFGFGLEMGWASILPGTLDNPGTPDVIEGAGYATNEVDSVTDRFFGPDGNDWATPLAAISIDAIDVFRGSDPPVGAVPGYEIQDWWVDNYSMNGVEFPQPDPIPTYRIPYTDDIERWFEGPMGLQGGRWSDVPDARLTVITNQNHTPGDGSGRGSASQALRLQNLVQTDVFDNMFTTNLPTTPRVRGEVGDPANVQAAMRFTSTLLSYGMDSIQAGLGVDTSSGNQPSGEDNAESLARFYTSGTDVNLMGDGFVYVRQRKPLGTDIAGGEFDASSPLAPTPGPHITPDQEDDINTEYINVLAAPSGSANFSLSTNDWHVVRLAGEPRDDAARGTASNGETEIVRIFVREDDTDFMSPEVELFPNGDDTQNFTTNAIAPTDLRFSSSNGFLAGFVSLFVDDIDFRGPTQTDTLIPLDVEFNDDPAWELPFADGLDSYETGRPASPQGFANHRLGFMPIGDPDLSPIPNDFDEIEFIDGADALSNGDPVRIYEIQSIDFGGGMVPFAVDDIVAVSDDLLREYDPDADIYGVIDDGANDPTQWYILDSVGGSEIARGTWFLANATGESVFDNTGPDPMVDMGARYSYRLNFRFGGTERENEFVSAADEGIDSAARGSRGLVAKMVNKANTRDFSPNSTLRGNTINMFNGFFPVAQTAASGDEAVMSYDFYVAQSDFQTGMQATVVGGTADGGLISGLSFGGMGFQSGNTNMDGSIPRLDTGNFGTLVPNPMPLPGEPENVWQDSMVAVPTLDWFTIEVRVNGDSEYTINMINGGMTTEIGSGVAIDASDPQLNTNSLDSVAFLRNQFGENDGEPTEGVVQWSARAFDAPAPLTGGVGEYHFFQIVDDVFVEAGQMLPQIWTVDGATGVGDTDMMGDPITRDIQATDIIAVINSDPMTMTPFDAPLVNDRYQIVEDTARGLTTIANGVWEPRGLPGADGVGGSAAPAGGLGAGNTPAAGYNTTAPYPNILLGDYVNVEANVVLPSDTWYVDSFTLELIEESLCTGDLDNSGDVDAGDLAILIAAWGSMNPAANLDGMGTVDAGDLAILIASWGPCP